MTSVQIAEGLQILDKYRGSEDSDRVVTIFEDTLIVSATEYSVGNLDWRQLIHLGWKQEWSDGEYIPKADWYCIP